MKLCKDCAHFVSNGSVPLCSHPEQPREPVFGQISALCLTARGKTTLPPWNKCGLDGKLFEERPPVAEVKPEARPQPEPVTPACGWWFDWDSIVSSIFR